MGWALAYTVEAGNVHDSQAFQTLEAVIDKLQEVILGLEKSVLKSTVSRQWTRLLFENN